VVFGDRFGAEADPLHREPLHETAFFDTTGRLPCRVTSCSSSVMSPAGHRIAAVDVGARLPLEADLFAADRHRLGDVLGGDVLTQSD
jgi:hypothetical protein